MPSPKLHFQRFEFKYHLFPWVAEQICYNLLNNNMVWDPFVQDRSDRTYTVTSLYFDSPTFRCYDDKISGLKDRFKLRLRIYKDLLEPGDDVFLEIKRKSDMVVLKDRVILPFNVYKEIFHGGGREVLSSLLSLSTRDQKILSEFFGKKYRYGMSPVVLVKYQRKPLVGKFNQRFRVTFDSHISASLADNLFSCRGIHGASPDITVMEVKYDNVLPGWFLRIIHKYQLDRQPFSKYCAGVEICKKYHQLSI